MAETIEHYELLRIRVSRAKPGEFRMRTAAVLSCHLCNHIIDGMGGPGNGPLCIPCGDDLRQGLLRGAVIRNEEPSNG